MLLCSIIKNRGEEEIREMKPFKNQLFISKYNSLKTHERKHWFYVITYMIIYFSIDFVAKKYNIAFAIWDTALKITLLGLVFLFGNFFCGKACFLARIQDGIDIVGKFIFRKKYNKFIGQKTRSQLKKMKYIFLVATLAIPLLLGSYDIFLKIFGLFLNLGFLFCLFDSHAYCKYFCFVGSLAKLSSLKNEKKLIRNAEKCINCNICSEVCLTNCDPGIKTEVINKDLWCTSCYRCKLVCPVDAIIIKK
jgi:polyferredoxin